MSRRRTGSRPRFEEQHDAAYCRVNRLCRECGAKVRPPRTSWCSDRCVQSYLTRAWPSKARRAVFRRDKGLCALCGLDTEEVRREVQAATEAVELSWREARGIHYGRWRPDRWCLEGLLVPGRTARKRVLRRYGMESFWRRKSFFDVDHIKAVADGGGECGLDNLRTLCCACHAQRTAAQAKQRRKKRSAKGRRPRAHRRAS